MSTPITGRQMAKVLELLEAKGVDSQILQDKIFGTGILSDVAEAAVCGTIPIREEVCTLLGLYDPRFQLLTSFPVVVPEGYIHATRLDTFYTEQRSEFLYYNEALTDANFARATTQLVPGQRFEVKIFQIKGVVSSEDCLAHLRSQKAVLVGAQGASLAYEQGKEQLPIGRWSVSFDEKDALWKDAGGHHRVPSVDRRSVGDFKFRLGYFEHDWNDYHCLLCFCDLSE